MICYEKEKTRAVIYIRYSSHKQRESFSIEYQVDECTKFIETNDYELVEVYIDEAKTGKKVAGRDAFDKMLLMHLKINLIKLSYSHSPGHSVTPGKL